MVQTLADKLRLARAAHQNNPAYRPPACDHLWELDEYRTNLYMHCLKCGDVDPVKRSDLTKDQLANVVRLVEYRNARDHCSWLNCPETRGIQLHHTAPVAVVGWAVAEQNPKQPYCEYHHGILTVAYEAWAAQPAQLALPLEAGS